MVNTSTSWSTLVKERFSRTGIGNVFTGDVPAIGLQETSVGTAALTFNGFFLACREAGNGLQACALAS
jgi:hypothetical protein